MTDMGDVSRILGTNVARDRDKGLITYNQRDYKEAVIERFGMKGCNATYTLGVLPEPSLNQTRERLLDEKDKEFHQSNTGAVMYLGQVSHYDILLAVNHLARAMSNPSRAPMRAAKQLLHYLTGLVKFSISYSRGGFKLTAYSDANMSNNPRNGNQCLRISLCSQMAPLASRWTSKV